MVKAAGYNANFLLNSDWGVSTQNDNKVYLHILNYFGETLALPSLGEKIKSVKLFKDKSKLKFLENEFGLLIKLPENRRGDIDLIIELEI